MCEETGVNETSSSAAGGDISFSDPKKPLCFDWRLFED
ncbi:hypothetical protein CHCC20348_2757 [Bacillus paralicheniformis]|nr:hypothetical protein CHCC20348_2757 [Bacillus paralicheniformis]